MKAIMKGEEDTPQSSVNGDKVTGLNEEGMFNVEQVEEIDDESTEDDTDQEEEVFNVEQVQEIDDESMEDDTDQEEEEEEDIEIEPPEDNAVLVFSKHTDYVFRCDIHPNGKLAVTVGKRDKAYVWAVETGELIMDLMESNSIFMPNAGHIDLVRFVLFSHDGTYLATADNRDLIKVWKCNLDENQQEPWTVAFEYEADDLKWFRWRFGTRELLIGTVSGNIYVLKVPSGETKVLQGHNENVQCFKLSQDGMTLAVGYKNGMVKIWDLKTSNSLAFSVHEMEVTDVDCNPENTLIASTSTNGRAFLTTINNGTVVGQEQLYGFRMVSVNFAPELGLLALRPTNGEVGIWEIAGQMRCHKWSNSNGNERVTKMIWIKNYLVTGCCDGSIKAYDGRSGEMVFQLTGHRKAVLDFCYNAKQNIILTSSGDGTARIFSLKDTGI